MPGSTVTTMPGTKGLLQASRPGSCTFQPDRVAQAMTEILSQRLAVQVLPVRVDVVVRRCCRAHLFVAPFSRQPMTAPGRTASIAAFCAPKHDVINLALPRCVLAVSGHSARDVRGIARILRGHVHQHDVAIFDLRKKLVVMPAPWELKARTDDGRGRLRLPRPPISWTYSILAATWILEQARPNHFHRFKVGIEREIVAWRSRESSVGDLMTRRSLILARMSLRAA